MKLFEGDGSEYGGGRIWKGVVGRVYLANMLVNTYIW